MKTRFTSFDSKKNVTNRALVPTWYHPLGRGVITPLAPARSLGSTRLPGPARPPGSTRPFSGGSTDKPQWQLDAEAEAQQLVGSRGREGGRGSSHDLFESKLKHELAVESVSNTSRMQSKLERLLAGLEERREDAAAFNRHRLECISARQDLIAQREAAGLLQEGHVEALERAYPIPSPR